MCKTSAYTASTKRLGLLLFAGGRTARLGGFVELNVGFRAVVDVRGVVLDEPGLVAHDMSTRIGRTIISRDEKESKMAGFTAIPRTWDILEIKDSYCGGECGDRIQQ
jgi:hypothetical protein